MDSVGKRLLFCLAVVMLQVAAFWAGNVKPKKGYEAMSWGTQRGTEIADDLFETIVLPENPHREIVRTKTSVKANIGGEEKFLTGGSPVWAVYFADLNGDGSREMIAEISTGGSTPTDVIVVYDFEKETTRTLDEPQRYNYTAEFRDGEIYVTKKPYGKPDASSVTGKLKWSEDGLTIK